MEIEQAQELLDELRDRYPTVYASARDGPLGRYHRVRIGPFETRQAAQRIANALTREGYYVFLDEVTASSILALRLHPASVGERAEYEDRELDGFDGVPGVAFRFGESW